MFCESVWLSGLSALLKKREMFQKTFYQKIFKITKELIEKIQKHNEEMVKRITFGSLEEKFTDRLDQIFVDKKTESIKGKEGKEIYRKLMEKYSISEENEKALERSYYDKSQKMV